MSEPQGFSVRGRLIAPLSTNAKGYATAYLLCEGSTQTTRVSGRADRLTAVADAPLGSVVTLALYAPRINKFGSLDVNVREVLAVESSLSEND